MSSQIESLVYVCTTSLAELKAQVAALDGAETRTIDARLRQLESTATTLSGALDRLSKHMDCLPADDPNASPKGPRPPEEDGGLLLRAARHLVEVIAGAGMYLGGDKMPTPEIRAARRSAHYFQTRLPMALRMGQPSAHRATH